MRSSIHRASKADIYELIRFYGEDKFDETQVAFFRKCVTNAAQLYVGFVDDEVVCFWGLIPPSLLSDSAYLWLYTAEELKGNEFVFVRQSQIAVREMLLHYTEVIGHTEAGNTKGIRWLRWLGAEFGHPLGQVIPFTIRRK